MGALAALLPGRFSRSVLAARRVHLFLARFISRPCAAGLGGAQRRVVARAAAGARLHRAHDERHPLRAGVGVERNGAGLRAAHGLPSRHRDKAGHCEPLLHCARLLRGSYHRVYTAQPNRSADGELLFHRLRICHCYRLGKRHGNGFGLRILVRRRHRGGHRHRSQIGRRLGKRHGNGFGLRSRVGHRHRGHHGRRNRVGRRHRGHHGLRGGRGYGHRARVRRRYSDGVSQRR